MEGKCGRKIKSVKLCVYCLAVLRHNNNNNNNNSGIYGYYEHMLRFTKTEIRQMRIYFRLPNFLLVQ